MTPIFKMALPRSIAYNHIDITFGRTVEPGARLKVEIEYFSAGERAPAKIVFGPLHKVAPGIFRDHNLKRADVVALLMREGAQLALVREVAEDMTPVPAASEFQLAA